MRVGRRVLSPGRARPLPRRDLAVPNVESEHLTAARGIAAKLHGQQYTHIRSKETSRKTSQVKIEDVKSPHKQQTTYGQEAYRVSNVLVLHLQ